MPDGAPEYRAPSGSRVAWVGHDRETMIMATVEQVGALPEPASTRYYRHSVVTRICHWINVVCVIVLLGTGLNIFNAHGGLYWGQYGADADAGRRWLEITSALGADGQPVGTTRVGGIMVETTGVLGLSKGADGALQSQAFPGWATIPSWRDLATGRRWHFFFAWLLILNGLVYLIRGFLSGHIQRQIWPRIRELRPANVLHDIVEHAKLKFPRGEDAKRYHVLQKIAYGGTVLILLPLMVLTGLSMSPGFNAAVGGALPELFGGRASARSIHFITTNLVVLFILVHVLMVVLAGPYNQIRSMITGRFDTGTER